MTEKSISLSLTGGPPWGFRLRGGPASGGLRVSRVRRRSPATAGGLREGDLLLSVNSLPVAGRTYAFVMEFAERQRVLDMEVRRLVGPEGTLLAAAATWASEEDDEDEEAMMALAAAPEPEPEPEPPLQELQVAELQLAPSRPQPLSLSLEELVDEDTVIPADPDVRPVPFSKLITEAQPEPTPPRSPVKKYADSAYFDATDASYPTVEEQKEMARRVAETLTDTRNRGSRGASMFEKRRERAAKYTLEGPEPGEEGFVGAAAGGGPGFDAMIDTSVSGPADEGGIVRIPLPTMSAPPPAPPPPPPPFAPPPPPPPNLAGFPLFGLAGKPQGPPPPKTVAEFVEREMRSAPKLTHRDYDPKKAFDIASALHSSSGKAGQMFQKRRQRALKFTTESEGRVEPASSKLKPMMAMQQPQVGSDISMAAKIQRLQNSLGGGGGGGSSVGGLSDL